MRQLLAACILFGALVGCADPKQTAEDPLMPEPETAETTFDRSPGSAFWLTPKQTEVDLRTFEANESREYTIAVDGPTNIGFSLGLTDEEIAAIPADENDSRSAVEMRQVLPDGSESQSYAKSSVSSTVAHKPVDGKTTVRVTNLLDKPIAVQIWTSPGQELPR
jgi:hypothetical protein